MSKNGSSGRQGKTRGAHTGKVPRRGWPYLLRMSALEVAVEKAQKQLEFKAQHGPVKELVKDGKALQSDGSYK